MDIRGYLRSEILEEGDSSHLTQEEVRRRLSLFDAVGGSPPDRDGTGEAASPMSVRAEDTQSRVAEDDPRIVVEAGRTTGDVRGVAFYSVFPTATPRAAGVLVIHENRGLTPHIRDVTRRLGTLGFAALAPDLLSPLGGAESFADPGEAIAALGSRSGREMGEDLRNSLSQLGSDPRVDPDRLGVIGFCFGGGMAWRLMAKDNRLKAGVPFYGMIPPLAEVPGIAAAVLGVYGALDERINAGIPEISRAMEAAGKTFEARVFAGAQHGFHNDTRPDRFHPEAAGTAWTAATGWLSNHLGR